MGIRYAGVDLPVPTEELRLRLENDYLLRKAVCFYHPQIAPIHNSPNTSPAPKAGYQWHQELIPNYYTGLNNPTASFATALFYPHLNAGQAAVAQGYESPLEYGYGSPEGVSELWPLHLGAVRWPTGARRWAVGHFLCTTEQLDKIGQQIRPQVTTPQSGRTTTAQAGIINVQPTPAGIINVQEGLSPRSAQLTLTDEDDGQVDFTMHLLLAKPLLGIRELEGIPDEEALYLLVLVDDRYFWWFSRFHDTVDDEDIPKPEDYPNLAYFSFAKFAWHTLGDANRYRFGRIHHEYGKNPSNAGYAGAMPSYPDFLATSLGSRILLDYEGNSFTQQHAEDGTEALKRNLAKFSDRLRSGGTGRTAVYIDREDFQAQQYLPSRFRFICSMWQEPGTPSALSELRQPPTWRSHYNYEFSLADIFPGMYGMAGVKKELNSLYSVRQGYHKNTTPVWDWDQSFFFFDQVGASKANRLARRIATDYCLFQMAPVDAVYNGVLDWEPEGISDYVEWRVSERDVSTTVRRPHPDNFMLPLANTTREDPILPLIPTADIYLEGVQRSGLLGYSTVPVVSCATAQKETKRILTQANPVSGEDITYLKSMTLSYTYLQVPNWYLSSIQAFRSTGLCTGPADTAIDCCPVIECCAPGRRFPPYLYLRVIDSTGDCACVIGFSTWLGGRGQNAGTATAHSYYSGIIPFILCDGPGGLEPAPWLGTPPEHTPQWSAIREIYAKLYVEFGCLRQTDGSYKYYLVTAGCNGYPGGAWEDFFYPPVRSLQCGADPSTTPFLLLTERFPVFDCCKGPNSTQTAENWIQIAIAETEAQVIALPVNQGGNPALQFGSNAANLAQTTDPPTGNLPVAGLNQFQGL